MSLSLSQSAISSNDHDIDCISFRSLPTHPTSLSNALLPAFRASKACTKRAACECLHMSGVQIGQWTHNKLVKISTLLDLEFLRCHQIDLCFKIFFFFEFLCCFNIYVSVIWVCCLFCFCICVCVFITFYLHGAFVSYCCFWRSNQFFTASSANKY